MTGAQKTQKTKCTLNKKQKNGHYGTYLWCSVSTTVTTFLERKTNNVMIL